MDAAFNVKDPDFRASPYTGMTKRHYIDCAKYLLERAFTHVADKDAPFAFPIVPGKTYPQVDSPPLALSLPRVRIPGAHPDTGRSPYARGARGRDTGDQA